MVAWRKVVCVSDDYIRQVAETLRRSLELKQFRTIGEAQDAGLIPKTGERCDGVPIPCLRYHGPYCRYPEAR